MMRVEQTGAGRLPEQQTHPKDTPPRSRDQARRLLTTWDAGEVSSRRRCHQFGVKKAVGIEMHRGRAEKASAYIEGLGLSDRIEIRNEDFIDSDIQDATIAYCGHYEVEGDLAHFEGELRAGSRMVTLFLPFVGVVPTAVDYPFYVMDWPFKRTRDLSLWTSKVLFKKATVDELYRELDTDREYRYDKRSFTRMMEKRFPMHLDTVQPAKK